LVYDQEEKHRMTEVVLGLESMDLGLCDSEPEPCTEDDNFKAMTTIPAKSTQLEASQEASRR
jgi:hypothetical protein